MATIDIVKELWVENPQVVTVPSGFSATAGGYKADQLAGDAPTFYENYPTDDGTGWVFASTNPPTAGVELYVVATPTTGAPTVVTDTPPTPAAQGTGGDPADTSDTQTTPIEVGSSQDPSTNLADVNDS
jgi:hypothetical protein